jgi:DNA-binding MarR family transcriptional regulator
MLSLQFGDLGVAARLAGRPVSLTEAGRAELAAERRRREGWLVRAIEELPPEDRATVERAIVLLRRLAEAEV